jgi:hypothetical protein
MDTQIATLIVAGLGIAGTLGGILVGHLLTRSWQQRQWLLDNRRQEYREVLNAVITMDRALRSSAVGLAYAIGHSVSEETTSLWHAQIVEEPCLMGRPAGGFKGRLQKTHPAKDIARNNPAAHLRSQAYLAGLYETSKSRERPNLAWENERPLHNPPQVVESHVENSIDIPVVEPTVMV